MNITLYKAAETVRELMSQIDENGELPPEFGSALTVAKERAGAVAAAIVSDRVHREAVKAHAMLIIDQVKAAEKREEKWCEYLLAGMQASGITEITDESGVVLVKRWPERDASVEIFDEQQVPKDYLIEPKPPAPKPDKRLIAQSIRDGFDVPGAKIIKKDRLKVGL